MYLGTRDDMRTRAFAATKSDRIWLPIIQCAWCKGIKVGRWYIPMPPKRLLRGNFWIRLPMMPMVVVGITHTACPHCAKKVRDLARRGRSLRKGASQSTPWTSCLHEKEESLGTG